MTRIVDLCAGSGMLAHAAAYTFADTSPEILSVDIDPAALAVCAAHGHVVEECDRIRLAGNGVCPRQAAAGVVECLDELDPIQGRWSNEFRDGIIRP